MNTEKSIRDVRLDWVKSLFILLDRAETGIAIDQAEDAIAEDADDMLNEALISFAEHDAIMRRLACEAEKVRTRAGCNVVSIFNSGVSA